MEFPINKENKVNIEIKNNFKENSNKIQIKRVRYNILGKETSDLQNRAHYSVLDAVKKIEKLTKRFNELMTNKNEILKNVFEQKLKNIFFHFVKILMILFILLLLKN